MDKREITVTYTEVAEGVYKPDYRCPPHIWYYANVIMHWKCSFCVALRHKKPKNAFIENETVTIKRVYIERK